LCYLFSFLLEPVCVYFTFLLSVCWNRCYRSHMPFGCGSNLRCSHGLIALVRSNYWLPTRSLAADDGSARIVITMHKLLFIPVPCRVLYSSGVTGKMKCVRPYKINMFLIRNVAVSVRPNDFVFYSRGFGGVPFLCTIRKPSTLSWLFADFWYS